jgi:hypothetical protein
MRFICCGGDCPASKHTCIYNKTNIQYINEYIGVIYLHKVTIPFKIKHSIKKYAYSHFRS